MLETTEVRATDPNSLSSQRNPGLKQPVLESTEIRATDPDSLSSQCNPGLKQPLLAPRSEPLIWIPAGARDH